MKYRKQSIRVLFFVFLLTCMLTGLAGITRAPARAAPQMQAAALSVVINEIGWAGTPASANHEWIELYNPGGSDIPLSSWTLQAIDGTPSISLSGTIVAGGYYLLERNDAAISDLVADLTYTGALANAGETLELRDNTNTVIDTANQTGGAWPAGGGANLYSMERIDVLADGPTAWASNNGVVRNGLDSSAPTPIPINGTPRQMNSATLALTATIAPTVANTPSPTNIATSSPAGTVIPSLIVFINEVAWAGTSSTTADDEWIELYNPGSSPIDITGWKLYGDNNTLNTTGDPDITLTGTILAGRYFLLEAKDDLTVLDVSADQIYTTGSLLNTGERLYLKDNLGNLVDTANVDGGAWPAGTAGTGVLPYASMERVRGTVDGPTAWVTYGAATHVAHDRNNGPIKGTPGQPNWITTVTITTITADTPDPSIINDNVNVKVMVIGGTTTPTGTVAITGANTNCTITLAAGTGACTVKFTTIGNRTLTATYSGDSTHPASSDTESHQVLSAPLPTPTITRTPTPLPPPPLIAINEFVPRPGHDWNGDGVINVGDEYIELLNHGVVDVDLSGYTLDDEVNIGSNPYRLPSVVMKPGERLVFFGSETGLLLSDGGDGVRLLKPNGQLGDAYNYRVVRHPDHTYCRYPDNGGADDWNTNCFPTPGLQNALSGSFTPPPDEDGAAADSACPLSDTQPDDFIWAECQPFGQNIFRPAYWDKTGWFGERYLPKSPGKWPVFVD